LRDAWLDITKHSFGVFIKVLRNDPVRLAGYFVAQYCSFQEGRLRLSYSWDWVFRGSCRVWRCFFALRYRDACVVGDLRAKANVLRDWHRVLGLDWFRRLRLFPFLRSGVNQLYF
jgi:hypothetical protein